MSITTTVTNIFLDDGDLYEKNAVLPRAWTYFSGTLTISDAYGLIIPNHIDRHETITSQPGSDIAYERLIAASPQEVLRLLEGLLCEWEFSSEEYSRK